MLLLLTQIIKVLLIAITSRVMTRCFVAIKLELDKYLTTFSEPFKLASLLQEGKDAPVWPSNVPIYDLQTQAPFLFDRFNPVFDDFNAMRERDPEAFGQLLLRCRTPEYPPPREGASKILQWEVNLVSKGITYSAAQQDSA